MKHAKSCLIFVCTCKPVHPDACDCEACLDQAQKDYAEFHEAWRDREFDERWALGYVN